MPRTPKGSYVRNSPDWFIHRMMVRQAFLAAVVGQFSYIGIYNNSTDGSYLYIQYLRFEHLTELDSAFFGQVGSNVLSASLPGRPLDAMAPTGFGLLGSANTGTDYFQAGTINNFGTSELGSPADNSYDWLGQFPLAAVAPGFTAMLQTHKVNQSLTATFWWFSAQK
jgi:hypothetical protein